MEWNDLDKCAAFKKLKQTKKVNLREALLNRDSAERVCSYQTETGAGLFYNYAAKQVNKEILALLQELSEEQALIEKYKYLLNGGIINTGENRMVLHHLTRGQLCKEVFFNGVNLREFYLSELNKIEKFCEKIHSGKLLSAKGHKFTDIVQIGIGGSDLGPRAMFLALEQWAKSRDRLKLNAHFISNIDPEHAVSVISSLNLESSLFIIVSKSGTTQETLANEKIIKAILKENNMDPSKSIAVVTSKNSMLDRKTEYLECFYIDDFIGGRYSSASACGGVVLSLAFGFEVFQKFLKGAYEADKSALEKDITKNAALLDALIGVYERNVLMYSCSAVLPYSQALSRFPAHLQQLDMESNGKTVNRFGKKVNYATGVIIFGESGTNGQHSFYQLLHQGSDIVPIQFIGFKKSQTKGKINSDNSEEAESLKKLSANLIAQIFAFAAGKDDSIQNKNFEGNRPSSLIYGEELVPETLGSLLAHFENKIMFQGFAWNLNSFDQEGVELGKTLTKKVLAGDTERALKEYAKIFKL